MNLYQKIFNFDIDNDKLKKNINLYYLIIFLFFYPISNFLSVFFGVYLIIFILSVSFLFVQSRKDTEDFANLVFLQWIALVVLIFVINLFHVDYFFNNFNIREENLVKIKGSAYCDKNYNDRIVVNEDIVLYDRFGWNRLMQTNICIDGLKNMEISYATFFDRFHNKKINLIYDMRDETNVYVDYKVQVKYYIDIQKNHLYSWCFPYFYI